MVCLFFCRSTVFLKIKNTCHSYFIFEHNVNSGVATNANLIANCLDEIFKVVTAIAGNVKSNKTCFAKSLCHYLVRWLVTLIMKAQ